MEMLPSRDEGGEWAKGRATCGAAAGYMARALMFRHKFDEAYPILKDIIAGKYGHYELMADYGDNFREGAEYENNGRAWFRSRLWIYEPEGPMRRGTPWIIVSRAPQGKPEKGIMPSRSLGTGVNLT